MQYLSIEEVIKLHALVVEQSGGAEGIRDWSALESCVEQPHQAFGDEDLYPSLPDKAAALGFFLVCNHPFVDGNKRVGHAALEVTLMLNGFELNASVDEQEQIILAMASGKLTREEFATWVTQHLRRL